MVVPLAARYVAAAVGLLLVVTSASSVIGTLIVPRSVANWLTQHVDLLVNGAFVLITKPVRDYRRLDRILATNAAAILIAQIAAWLGMFFVGFALIFWPLVHGGITEAFRLAGPGIWQIGNDGARTGLEAGLLDVAAVIAIVTMVILVVGTNFFVFRPLVAWSDRFRLETSETTDKPKSIVLDLLRRSSIPRTLGRLTRPIGRFLDHLFTLIATVAALALHREWSLGYADLLKYATPGFFAFGLFALHAGWFADKWSR